jgi:MFS family permease
MTVMSSYTPILFALTFLEKEPESFECYHDDTGEWTECSKTEICEGHLDHDHYRAKEDDPEYIDNWVEKFDMLCEPRWRVGLIGAFFFFGIIVTMIPVPRYSDLNGRRNVFIVTMCVAIVSAIGLLACSSLEWAYFFMFLNGLTFAGKIIVGLNYLIELQLAENGESMVTILSILGSIAIML